LNAETDLELSKDNQAKVDFKFISYPEYLQSILFMQPEGIETKLTESEKLLVDALILLKKNKIDDAKQVLEKSLTSEVEQVQNLSRDYLSLIYLMKDNYIANSELFQKQDMVEKLEKIDIMPTEIVNIQDDSLTVEIENNLILVPLKIKGKQYRFLFDTGTDKSIIRKSLQNEFDFDTFDLGASIESSSAEIDVPIVSEIDTVKIGNNTILNNDFLVLEDENLNFSRGIFSSDLELDGIIGWDIIKEFSYLFDFEKELIVLNPTNNYEKSENVFWLGAPFVRLQHKEGYEFNFFFDSGSYQSEITDMLPQKLELNQIDEIENESQGIGGKLEYTSKVYEEVSLVLNNTTLRFDEIETTESNNFGYCYFDGVLGADFLMSGKIFFSINRGILKVTEVY